MKCSTCNKAVIVGQWTCSDGVTNHVVEEKTYRVLDAPADRGTVAPGSSAPIVRGRTMVCNIPPAKKVMENGEVRMVGENSVEFINGRFTTKDPEIQYWLDKKPGYQHSEEEWKKNWLTTDELLSEKEMQLNAMAQRLENERNDLLAMTKQSKGA